MVALTFPACLTALTRLYDAALPPRLSASCVAVGIEGYGQSTWAQAKAAGIADRERKPDYSSIECCGLKSRFTQWVNFNTDCYQDDIFAKNFTQRLLGGRS